jgi:hypothetical protein
MKKLIYRFSLLVSVVAFISSALSGISIGTSLMRSMFVFLGMMFIIVITLKLLRWGIIISAPKQIDQAVKQNNE